MANGSTVVQQTHTTSVVLSVYGVGVGGGGLVVLIRLFISQGWWSGGIAPVGSERRPGPSVGKGLSRHFVMLNRDLMEGGGQDMDGTEEDVRRDNGGLTTSEVEQIRRS